MGLLDKLNSGPTKNAQSLLGQIPATVPGASPSSQTHSQGAFDMEGQGAVNDRGESIGSLSSTTGNGTNRPASATNLNFKKKAKTIIRTCLQNERKNRQRAWYR